MKKRTTIALLSKGLARYRYNFTEHFAAALAGRARVIAAPLGEDLWEVDFPALKAAHGLVIYRDFPHSWHELDHWNPDILGIMEYSAPMLNALFWARARHVPVVVFTEVGAGEPKQTEVKAHTRMLHSMLAHLTEAQVALAPAARRPFGARYRPVQFAPHSIDTTEFTPRTWNVPADRKRTLLTVAQYLPRKGLDLMADALSTLKRDGNFEWRIVGTQDATWLRQVVSDTGLQEHAVITGPKQGDALVQEFQGADVFVLPSRFDTYGVVTQEAAASGLPLVVSKHAGSSVNLVQNGKNGFVIDPHNKAEFAERLKGLIESPESLPAMGARSRAIAESYCVRKIGRQVADWMMAVPGR